jgi:replicative superfamily II helicase
MTEERSPSVAARLFMLSLLRNPHGYHEDTLRKSRLDAADYIERGMAAPFDEESVTAAWLIYKDCCARGLDGEESFRKAIGRLIRAPMMTEERIDSPRRMTPQEIEAVRVSPNIRKWLEMMRDSLAEAELYGFADECRRRLAMLEKETTEERSDSPNWKAVAEDVADWIDELCVGTLRSDTKRQVADFVRNHYKHRPEAKFAKSTEERSDSPRPEWVYSPIDGLIYSSNFHHDAALKLTGDFVDDEEKTAYAEKLCALLNGKP